MKILGEPTAPGLLSSDKAKACAEAGGFCFEYNGHASGVQMRVVGDVAASHEVRWPPLAAAAYPAWADLDEAVEEGATGIAMLLMREETGCIPIARAVKGTGIDYWLDCPLGAASPTVRMETSGILDGGEREIRKRVNQKLRQTERSDATGLPAYVVVVEFSRPEARLLERTP